MNRRTSGDLSELDNAAEILLLSLIAPMMIWVLVNFLNISEFSLPLEEAFKGLLAMLVVQRVNANARQIVAILTGLCFGVSEAIFYLYNINILGSFGLWGWRVVGSVPMHALTLGLLVFVAKGRVKLIPAGLIITIGIHYGFNWFLGAW